ncbi:hypothetical protein LguiA_010334 [Lonicera macranthoides]
MKKKSCITDRGVELQSERDGNPIGPKTPSEWVYLYAEGLEKLLVLVKEKYNNPLIYITENGIFSGKKALNNRPSDVLITKNQEKDAAKKMRI